MVDVSTADDRPDRGSGRRLVLGPLLRYVDDTSATVWVETSEPCTVEVLGFAVSTVTVHGHHYAFVDVAGLTPGTATAYEVRLDGEVLWPEPGSNFPVSRIRTLQPGDGFRLVFGSCRTSVRNDVAGTKNHGVDVLRAYGHRLRSQPDGEWPDTLLMLGDQVYADEPSDAMLAFIKARRSVEIAPHGELADFEEYTEVYAIAWREPTIRWLLSTVPSLMIFDDHDVRDDWNTSAEWRAEMARKPWWPARIVGGLASYWIYQHLGNLSAAERASDPTWVALIAADGDAGDLVDAFAADADANPRAHRWSYARDFGRRRLVVLDSRCGRVLTPGHRTMLDDVEWSWFDALAQGDVDHLLIGSSLPYLLPRGLHELEQWDESIADGRWGKRARRVAEKIRQGVDLEHWGAFHHSFTAMAGVIKDVASGRRAAAPASVIFLSGDVHYSYLMRAELPTTGALDGGPSSAVYQAVCSPIRNPLGRAMRYASTAASFGVAGVLGRALARTAGLHERALDWSLVKGPVFDNALATLDLDGRAARLEWESADQPADDAMPVMRSVAAVELTSGR